MKLMLSRTVAAIALIATPTLAGATTIDFSGHGTGGQIGNTYASSGVTFSAATFDQCIGGCPAPMPNGYFAYDAGNMFTAFFSATQNSIAFQYASFSSTLAQAFNASNNLVASFGHDEALQDNAQGVLTGSGITHVVFSSNGGSNGPAITNLTFSSITSAAPEPAAWMMMIAGFGIAGFALRRRQKATMRLSYAI